jgi:biopolymer transport protein ExbB
MNPRILRTLTALLITAAVARGAETFDQAMKRATDDYAVRLQKAADELNGARKQIADEKAPLLQEERAAENRIVAAESEIERFNAAEDNSAENRRKLLIDLEATRKNTTYITTLAHDTLKGFQDGFSPGEGQPLADPIQALEQRIDDTSAGPNGRAAADVAEFLLDRTRAELGGYAVSGSSLIAGGNEVVKGTFAYAGPETYFLPDSGGKPSTVRANEGAIYPVAYELSGWKADDASAYFQGKPAAIMVDASGGKALKLRETKGSVLQHIQKGGLVAYAIIAVGLLALLMIAQKISDLSKLAVDAPAKVHAFLATVARGDLGNANSIVGTLKEPLRELYAVGLRHCEKPKAILEEHLQSVLLRQRLFFERRLPLLAVIATAAPLMGLLGTVVGMVKTFALITVFGTGNAGKLASGISEVLVATELGLVVAIPTLIAHGFLAHRIQKNLSILERYALEFVTASETARESKETIPA